MTQEEILEVVEKLVDEYEVEIKDTISNAVYEAVNTVEVDGKYSPATYWDPPEYPTYSADFDIYLDMVSELVADLTEMDITIIRNLLEMEKVSWGISVEDFDERVGELYEEQQADRYWEED